MYISNFPGEKNQENENYSTAGHHDKESVMVRIPAFFCVLIASTAISWAQSSAPAAVAGTHIAPIINRVAGVAARSGVSASSVSGSNGIAYNGGPIMDDANGVNVYYIWYGDWSKDKLAQKVLINFITHIGGSPYFNINTTYYSYELGPSGTKLVKDPVVNAVHYMGSANDYYSQGTQLTDDSVYAAVANSITSGALPADPNGVYFLLTSGDVNETSGFGSSYCAWHDSTADLALPLVDGTDIKFAFVGNAATQYAYQCIFNYQTTMSGSLAADGMASFIAHELEESVTDPDGTSWINLSGEENADLCGSIFPGPYHSGTASDPEPPDMMFGGVPYLIQENWVNAKGGYCAIRWDE